MNFEFYSTLPFADGKFERTPHITTPVTFQLKKSPETTVTMFPVHDAKQVPHNLLQLLYDEYTYVVEEGTTYPYSETKPDLESFISFWFVAFVGILIEGDFKSLKDPELEALSTEEWKEKFLGNFFLKPNYAGRCSHVCNGGFLVNHTKRGLGLGKELGWKYLEWAPKLGYAYSVFNLVFESNVASVRIWDALGFDRIGYVKNVAALKGQDKLVGAIVYGKDLLETS